MHVEVFFLEFFLSDVLLEDLLDWSLTLLLFLHLELLGDVVVPVLGVESLFLALSLT